MIKRLAPTQAKILLNLAQYKFLTTSQMITLGVATQRSNLAPHLRSLKDGLRPFIDCKEFGFHPQKGRLENFYFLKRRGKQALIDGLQLHEEEILLPIGTSTIFTNDYFHRKFTLDCHIAVQTQSEAKDCELIFFERYFDKLGSNRSGGTSRAKTRINMNEERYLIADGVFMLQTTKQKELYCLEVCNGRDSKRIHKQTSQYIHALVSGSPSIKYNHTNSEGQYRGFRVLNVFEHKSCMDAVIERISKDIAFANLGKFFYFNTMDAIKKTFFDDWKGIDRGQKKLF